MVPVQLGQLGSPLFSSGKEMECAGIDTWVDCTVAVTCTAPNPP